MSTREQKDNTISRNLERILTGNPNILRPDVEVSVERDKLCEDMAALIARIPLNEKQGRILYDAIVGRFQNKTCYKCLRVKCVLGGSFIHPDGDLAKPKRFICGECK